MKKGRKSYKQNPLLAHKPSEVTDLQITEINNMNISWKANTCMLTKSHKDYG
jgi:hypothetical protein